ncbi:MAG: phosphoadenylyl-sulfate reductase [Solirubrobacteraceae bacterium]
MTATADIVEAAGSTQALAELNRRLAGLDASRRVAWGLEHLPGVHALSSSFGAQAAVSLHLVTRQAPNIPVILIDTGYLFAETYRYADDLSVRLALNLHVYRPSIGRAWMEARVGRLWDQGIDGIERYNRIRKIEPLQHALKELEVHAWIAGLRRSQSKSRAGLDVLERRDGRWKLHPLADWSQQDVEHYIRRHDLPDHPLRHLGYVSIGDTHTTARLEAGMREEDTRFFGLKRECGLHFDHEPERPSDA